MWSSNNCLHHNVFFNFIVCIFTFKSLISWDMFLYVVWERYTFFYATEQIIQYLHWLPHSWCTSTKKKGQHKKGWVTAEVPRYSISLFSSQSSCQRHRITITVVSKMCSCLREKLCSFQTLISLWYYLSIITQMLLHTFLIRISSWTPRLHFPLFPLQYNLVSCFVWPLCFSGKGLYFPTFLGIIS